VEIRAAVSRNLPQFNILPRIALFVCNIGPFSSSIVPDARTIASHEFKIGMQSNQGSALSATYTAKATRSSPHRSWDQGHRANSFV